MEWSGVHVGQLRAWNTFRTEMGRADAEADGDGEREKEPERLSHQGRKAGRTLHYAVASLASYKS